jgi:tetratricopeptide (TPR) repeat protein
MTGPVPLPEFWPLATQCLEALAAAHAHGVIHRDIKPENLMLAADGQIKILDFGIARRTKTPGASAATAATATATMTAGGRSIAGTPQYMAPEAHYGGPIDQRTDIFSLGVVFYELLTGLQPFAGPSLEAVFQRVMTATPRPVAEVSPDVGGELSDAIAKMLAKEPAHRQASCREVMDDLARARTVVTTPASGRPTTALGTADARRRGRWVVAAVAFPLVAVGAATLLLGLGTRWLGGSLPADRNLAVLAPATPGATDDFAGFALGAVELLSRRLQRHQAQPGFQLASFQEGVEEKRASATDAHKVLGTNLALTSTLEQRTNVLRARLELWDATRDRVIRTRVIEVPIARPFDLLDRIYAEAATMAGLAPRSAGASDDIGVSGTGTLRFLVQGIGRMRRAQTEPEARRAVEDLELACRTDPGAAAARAWLAGAQLKVYQAGDDHAWLDRAELSAREAVALDSTRAEPHRFLAAVLASARKAPESLAELERACALNPTDDDGCYFMGRTQGRVGEPERERDTYLATIARRPHCWKPHWWLATWHFRQGHVEESIRAYQQMIRRAPDLYRGYESLGGVLVLHGDYDRAIDTLQHAIALRPTKIAFDNLGTAYFNTGRLTDAIAAYNQSFQFGFANYGSWVNLGDAYYWLRNRQDQAADAYGQAVRLGREESQTRAQQGRSFDVMIPANLATVFPKLSQPDSARVYLRRALDADSTNTMVMYCAALTCWQLQEKDRALNWLVKAVRGGYPVGWLRDSPIFREWRDQEGFRALIADAGPQTSPHAEGGRR